ncbi:ABATE domain-containing protein [Rheinheimera sp.]|uniref:CGNR zinc finger domain-containing protein n=1 Tax=Rheinheimera sp. TaxID=1869214 RepID=UPI00307FBAD0
MSEAATTTEQPQSGAPMLGDHLAMDLLNTEARADGQPVEFWSNDQDLLHWLARYGISQTATVAPADLLPQAKALRALAHQLISQFRAGQPIDYRPLNPYLQAYSTVPYLEQDAEGTLTLSRHCTAEGTGALLGPVAEAVAQLLVEGNAALVKQCEHPDCILWFYDRTKAHKRRWCSMALCGNRHKAAQFRKRSGG